VLDARTRMMVEKALATGQLPASLSHLVQRPALLDAVHRLPARDGKVSRLGRPTPGRQLGESL
jgi:hypothetical protein